MKRLKLILILAVSAIACGGKDDNKSPGGGDNGPGVQSGTFIAAQGVHFATATQSGLTDASGTFTYLAGETVAFTLGGITLGAAPGASTLTPFDLAGATPPTNQGQLQAYLARAGINPFDRAINIDHFLLVLDADSDASNGIDVSGWDTALAGVTLDFGVKWRIFPGTLTIFALRHKIPNVNAVTTAEPVVHLYAALALSPAVYLDSVLAITPIGPGSSRRFTETYDASGNVLENHADDDGDGIEDEVTVSTYDAESRLLTQTDTPTRMDETSSKLVATYASNGDLLSSVTTTYASVNAGGAPSAIDSFVYTHDASNTHFTTTHTVDRHASGTINETYTTVDQYDTNGFLTLETYHQHYDGENDFTTNTGYTYDASSNLTQTVAITITTPDAPTDNKVTTNYVYDANQRVTTREELTDVGLDGTIDSRAIDHSNYDAIGNVTSAGGSLDSNGDGTIEHSSTSTFAFDSTGNITEEVDDFDTNGDGTVDTHDDTTYVYDANGQLLTRTSVINNAAQPDNVDTNVYGDHGEQLTNTLTGDDGSTATLQYVLVATGLQGLVNTAALAR